MKNISPSHGKVIPFIELMGYQVKNETTHSWLLAAGIILLSTNNMKAKSQ